MLINKQAWIVLCLAATSFLLTRILFLWFAYPASFWDSAELYRGVLAHDLITGGLTRPLLDYQSNHYGGGAVIVGLMAVPFFLIFGPSAFALKLVALTFFTATLIVWCLFCLRFYNRNVTALFSVLYIFSPVCFTDISITTIGYYTESVLFTALAVFLFCEIVFTQKSRRSYFIALGLVTGFGVWFNYATGITLITLILCWCFHDHKFVLKKGFWIFSLGFLLGFSPWIYYNLTHQFLGLWIEFVPLHRFFAINKLLNIFSLNNIFLNYMIDLLVPDCRNLWTHDRKVLLLAYFLIFITAFFSMLWDKRKHLLTSKESIFTIHCILLALAFQMCAAPDPGQLISFCIFVFLTLALFLNKLFESRKRYSAAFWVLIAFLVFMAIGSNLNVMSTKFAGYGTAARGYSYESLGSDDAWKWGPGLAAINKYASLSKTIKSAYLDSYNKGFAETLRFESPDNLIEGINFAKQIDAGYRKYIYRTIGTSIHGVLNNDTAKAKEVIQTIEVKDRQYVYEGWVQYLAISAIDYAGKMKVLSRLDEASYSLFYRKLAESFNERDYEKIDAKYLPYLFEGVGAVLADRFVRPGSCYDTTKEQITRCLKSVERKYLYYVYLGMGGKMADLVKEDPANLIFWDRLIKELKAPYQKYCREGFNANK